MSYVIISDSGCSLTKKEIEECGVKIIDFTYLMDGKENVASNVSDIVFFYDQLRNKQQASTSCINVSKFIEVFKNELDKGNDIISVSLSSGLSSTYQNSLIAKDELINQYPNRKIICIDSLLASYGTGMLIYDAGMLHKQGKSIEEVANFLNTYKFKATALFTVEDLYYLYKGGRVKPSSYFLAKAIHIKPLLHVDNEGKLIPYGKALGRKKSLIALVEKMVETLENPEDKIIYIGHGDSEDDVDYVIEQINKRIKVKGYKVSYIDPVIGVHSGPGTLALFYYSETRI